MSNKANNRIIDDFFDEITPEELEQTRISLDIAMRLHDILDEKGMTQKDLAQLIGKKESEISRWLKGMHNFTMKSIAKLQVALDAQVIKVPVGSFAMAEIDSMNAKKNELQQTPPLTKLRVEHFSDSALSDLQAA